MVTTGGSIQPTEPRDNEEIVRDFYKLTPHVQQVIINLIKEGSECDETDDRFEMLFSQFHSYIEKAGLPRFIKRTGRIPARRVSTEQINNRKAFKRMDQERQLWEIGVQAYRAIIFNGGTEKEAQIAADEVVKRNIEFMRSKQTCSERKE